MLVATLNGYRDAVYSLQPAGDDPARKAVIDSLTLGCIPVLFHRAQLELWGTHWGPWLANSSVYLPYEKVISGELDVLAALRAVPPERVEQMQRTIATHAQRMVYGFWPDRGDALGVLLEAVQRRMGAAGVPPRSGGEPLMM